jgi:hypothetical protein
LFNRFGTEIVVISEAGTRDSIPMKNLKRLRLYNVRDVVIMFEVVRSLYGLIS